MSRIEDANYDRVCEEKSRYESERLLDRGPAVTRIRIKDQGPKIGAGVHYNLIPRSFIISKAFAFYIVP